MQHAACNTQRATCNVQHATCLPTLMPSRPWAASRPMRRHIYTYLCRSMMTARAQALIERFGRAAGPYNMFQARTPAGLSRDAALRTNRRHAGHVAPWRGFCTGTAAKAGCAARPSHICAGTGLTPLTSPGLGSPLSHLRDGAHHRHIRTSAPTALTPPIITPNPFWAAPRFQWSPSGCRRCAGAGGRTRLGLACPSGSPQGPPRLRACVPQVLQDVVVFTESGQAAVLHEVPRAAVQNVIAGTFGGNGARRAVLRCGSRPR
jgi:hypothetical protein